MNWTIYWTKRSGVILEKPERDSGYCVQDINMAYRDLQYTYTENPKRIGQEWDGYIDEWK